MNNYIEAVCEGKPLDLPSFNEDSEQWELYFEESPTEWHPYSQRDLIAVSFDSADQACNAYNHYNQG
jgi:hypothetical protein